MKNIQSNNCGGIFNKQYYFYEKERETNVITGDFYYKIHIMCKWINYEKN